MISIGNSLPFFPPSDELNPCTDLLRQRFGRRSRTVGDQPFRKTLRDDAFHLLPHEFVPRVSELPLRLKIHQDDRPLAFTTTIASGEASSRPRYLSSICARCSSASLRSRDVANCRCDQRSLPALSRGLSMISIGNSLPSFRNPLKFNPATICCAALSVAAARALSAISRSAKPSGMMSFNFLPYEFIRQEPELLFCLNI